ncbi:peptide chain release factor H [Silvimonas sp. JCM 19000]
MLLLQLSAAQGPAECELAVVHVLAALTAQANAIDVQIDVLERTPGRTAGTLSSALLSLEGSAAEALAQSWIGSIRWTCPSPYRPGHARKNWFIGIARCAAPPAALGHEIRFETCRAAGPGGQHVNKTESAIRATHIASGISVRVQTERSQHANKRLALALIAHRLAERAEAADAALRAQRRQMHLALERGNPVRSFKGERFIEIV